MCNVDLLDGAPGLTTRSKAQLLGAPGIAAQAQHCATCGMNHEATEPFRMRTLRLLQAVHSQINTSSLPWLHDSDGIHDLLWSPPSDAADEQNPYFPRTHRFLDEFFS